MCIRDSPVPELIVITPVTAIELVPVIVTLLAALPALTVRAVSYTHLRAHETVLDIVCRLLLEKKNTNNQNNQSNNHQT